MNKKDFEAIQEQEKLTRKKLKSLGKLPLKVEGKLSKENRMRLLNWANLNNLNN